MGLWKGFLGDGTGNLCFKRGIDQKNEGKEQYSLAVLYKVKFLLITSSNHVTALLC